MRKIAETQLLYQNFNTKFEKPGNLDEFFHIFLVLKALVPYKPTLR